jgi:calcineurin-like phosphoesterase family protein
MQSDIREIKTPNARRVWFITDTHLGIRNNSNDWIDIISDYFNNWFLPLVDKEYREGDVLIHLGDYYDSRQSVNLKVLNLGVDIAEKLSQRFKDGVHIIIGNHDIWGKSSNDINSLKSLKWIPNINIHEEPTTLKLGKKSFFLMPWRKDHDAERECLDQANPHDYLCCHTDVTGMRFNRFVKIEEGIKIEDAKKFGSVYSGHIHYAQELGNIKMLGSPYELTRSDRGNKKGITVLDLESGDETYFENTRSPKFLKFDFNKVLELTIEDAERMMSNSFVDIMIDSSMSLRAPLNILTDEVTSPRKISFHPYDPNQVDLLNEQLQSNGHRTFSVMDFIEGFVSSLDHDDSTKNRIVSTINKLHRIITTGEQEDKI